MPERGDIWRIGTVDADGIPHGWIFDGHKGSIPALEITPDGQCLYTGYTVEELRNISLDYLSQLYATPNGY